MRNEHQFLGDLVAVDTPRPFGVADHVVHDLAYVIDVESRAVERTICRRGRKDFAYRRHTAFARGLGALQDQRGPAHTDDQAVPAAVERNGRVLDPFVCRRRPGRQETGPEPLHQIVRGDVVGGDYHDPTTTTGGDPVARHCHGLTCAGARAIH